MYILVLDTIHGGEEIARHLETLGHKCDMVDIYRHEKGISEEEAKKNRYDLIIAPVHLNPIHPLLNYSDAPVITHHAAVEMILGERKPSICVEITGARGKTTTAFALSHILSGKGILHTSKGTMKIPENEVLYKKSITPASVISAALSAYDDDRWLIAEESLGVCGVCSLAVLTSDEDYSFAGKTKSALYEKIKTLNSCKRILLSPACNAGITGALHASDFVSTEDDRCLYSYKDAFGNLVNGSFSNPLLLIEGYREAIMTAAAAGCILGKDPKNLEKFMPVEGRMSVSKYEKGFIIDNSNSGVNKNTAVLAASYARKISGDDKVTLVIGIEAENICEGFSPKEVSSAIREINPEKVILVGDSLKSIMPGDIGGISVFYEQNLDLGRKKALYESENGSIVLCVKTWR